MGNGEDHVHWIQLNEEEFTLIGNMRRGNMFILLIGVFCLAVLAIYHMVAFRLSLVFSSSGGIGLSRIVNIAGSNKTDEDEWASYLAFLDSGCDSHQMEAKKEKGNKDDWMAKALQDFKKLEALYLHGNASREAPLVLAGCKCRRSLEFCMKYAREPKGGVVAKEFRSSTTLNDIRSSDEPALEWDRNIVSRMETNNPAVAKRIAQEAFSSQIYTCKAKGDWQGAIKALEEMKFKGLEPLILDRCVVLRACQNAHRWDEVAKLLIEIRAASRYRLRLCDEVQADLEGKGPPRPPPFVQKAETEVWFVQHESLGLAGKVHVDFHAQQSQCFEDFSKIVDNALEQWEIVREVDRLLMTNPKCVDEIQARAKQRLSRAAEPPIADDFLLVDFAPGGPQRFIGVEDMDPGENVYVISLARRPSKRLRALRELKEAKLRAYVMDAVDGDALESQADVTRCGARVMPGYVGTSHYKLPFTTGEFGCFLSHWSIYEMIARQNIPCALILEDDFNIVVEPKSHFKSRLSAQLRQASKIEHGWDILYLGDSPQEDDVDFPAGNLSNPGFSAWTVGYVIRRSGALKILAAEGKRNMAPLDLYISTLRGRPLLLPFWFNARSEEWFTHIPGASEGELRGLACRPPLVMPLPSAAMLSDTSKQRRQTRYLRDLPTNGSPCVVEDPAVGGHWQANPPPY